MLELCGGSVYITSLYATDVRERFFHGSGGQEKIEQLVFASNLGNWLPAAGFYFDSWMGGPRNTAAIASVLTLVGYLGVWAWSAGTLKLAYWQVWLFWFLWGHGSGWFDCAAMTVTVRNFPKQRGRAVATMKAFYGLSGSILTQVFAVFFFEQTSNFLFFLAVTLTALGLLSSQLVWLVPKSFALEFSVATTHRLDRGLMLIVSLAVLLMSAGIAKSRLDSSYSSGIASGAFGCIVVVLCLLCAVTMLGPKGLPSPAAGGESDTTEEALVGGVPPSRALRMPEMWLLFVIMFTAMGSGLVVLNNAGQMADAFGHDEKETALLVSFISVANCFGRMAFGIVPDLLRHIPRAAFCAGNLVLMGSAMGLVAVGAKPALFVGGVIAGFSYGGCWTLVPTLVCENFGTESFATLYNVLSLAVSSASLIFSTTMASRLYDEQAKLHPALAGGCLGPTCYRSAGLIMVAACGVGFVASLLLLQTMRRRAAAVSGHCTRRLNEA